VIRAQRHRPRGLLVASAACFAGVAALAVALPALRGVDEAWQRSVAGPRPVALAFDWYGHSPSWIVPLLIGILLIIRRRPWSALFVVTGRIAAGLASNLIKALTSRDRPPNPLVQVSGFAFPSGHVVAVAATVVLVGALLTGTARRIWWGFGAILTVIMGWSRAYLHAHWLTDTLAGALLGAGVALLWWWLFQPRLREEAATG